MKKIQEPWGAVKLGSVGNALLTISLPIIFIVATIGSAFAMLFSKKKS